MQSTACMRPPPPPHPACTGCWHDNRRLWLPVGLRTKAGLKDDQQQQMWCIQCTCITCRVTCT
jgi:hypothetical protein